MNFFEKYKNVAKRESFAKIDKNSKIRILGFEVNKRGSQEKVSRIKLLKK
ncbi:27648_t:CDS:2 [Gigaspora margarita]|uniref:27648_t:CDS:1 n=1 Tax=Gigaspora margarita TaxID=4874 RepID=A0ABN7UQA5_GIGMA|nr:27648_t:CDS:2 [Gigaspora margarita]